MQPHARWKTIGGGFLETSLWPIFLGGGAIPADLKKRILKQRRSEGMSGGPCRLPVPDFFEKSFLEKSSATPLARSGA
jgi:hypothetical protein